MASRWINYVESDNKHYVAFLDVPLYGWLLTLTLSLVAVTLRGLLPYIIEKSSYKGVNFEY